MGPSWPSRICTSMDRPTMVSYYPLPTGQAGVCRQCTSQLLPTRWRPPYPPECLQCGTVRHTCVSMQCSQYGTGNTTQFILLFLLSSGSKQITPLSGALITSYSTGLHQTSLSDAQCIGVHVCGSLCPAAQVHEEGSGYQGPVGGTDGTC